MTAWNKSPLYGDLCASANRNNISLDSEFVYLSLISKDSISSISIFAKSFSNVIDFLISPLIVKRGLLKQSDFFVRLLAMVFN